MRTRCEPYVAATGPHRSG